jgi:hypothetical protein
MAIRHIVTGGFGNGTFSGTIPLVVTRGYAVGVAVVPVDPVPPPYRPQTAAGVERYRPSTARDDLYRPRRPL